MNNFNLPTTLSKTDGPAAAEARNLKLVATTFQNLFPSIDVQKMHLSQARRVVILNYNNTSKTIDMRHYLIMVRAVGISKPVRNIVQGSRRKRENSLLSISSRSTKSSLPDMSPNQDVSQYILHPNSDGDTSASEVESDTGTGNGTSSTRVLLGSDYLGRNNRKSEQRAIKLVELGPRLELKLIKIEAGMCTGQVLHHEFVKKSKAEADELELSHVEKLKLKEERRAKQAADVLRKQASKPKTKSDRDVEEADLLDDEEVVDEQEDEGLDLDIDLDEVAAMGYSDGSDVKLESDDDDYE